MLGRGRGEGGNYIAHNRVIRPYLAIYNQSNNINRMLVFALSPVGDQRLVSHETR